MGTLFVDRKSFPFTIILVDDTISTAPSSTLATPTVAPTTTTENNN
jgi:hypothetical protein